METKQKKQFSRRDETNGRIIMIVLTMIPITLLLVYGAKFSYYLPIYVFLISTTVVVFSNQIMSKIMRKKYKEITKEKMQSLFNDKSYGPAIFSRALTFALSIIGAFIISWLSSVTGYWNGFLFLIIGYLYFTMIQFRKL